MGYLVSSDCVSCLQLAHGLHPTWDEWVRVGVACVVSCHSFQGGQGTLPLSLHPAQMEPEHLLGTRVEGARAASCWHLSTSLQPCWASVRGMSVGRRRNNAAHSPSRPLCTLPPSSTQSPVDTMEKGAQNFPLCSSLLEGQWPPLQETEDHCGCECSSTPPSLPHMLNPGK